MLGLAARQELISFYLNLVLLWSSFGSGLTDGKLEFEHCRRVLGKLNTETFSGDQHRGNEIHQVRLSWNTEREKEKERTPKMKRVTDQLV